MRRLLCCLSLSILAGAAVVPASAPILDLARLLDDYSAGRFDRALSAVESAGDAQAMLLRTQWRGAGRTWIDADLTARPQRLLAAASFALETEHLRVERGAWMTPMAGVCPPDPRSDPKDKEAKYPAGPCVIEWAWSLLVERGAPDWAERAWVLAASSLVSGVRDFRFLYRPAPGAVPDARGLVAAALVRHPDDPRLRLEEAIALAFRFNVTTDGGGPQPLPMTIINLGPGGRGAGRGRGPLPEPALRSDSRESVVAQLEALATDPEVGAEARVRLGYLLWATGETDRAREELKRAAGATRDRDLQYLARFLRGWFALKANRPADAIPDFEAALEVRPHSQSAVLALASLELQRGEAARAHNLTRDALASLPDDDDPWREFLYGHYPKLPSLVAELRKHVRP
jgi:tetratricopeptide (TPR) repeat protein